MSNLYHNLTLLNNTRLEHDPETNETVLWVYHDKNYKNGSFYKIDHSGFLSFCTVRDDNYDEQIIKWDNQCQL